jgi:serine/threonine protein kinase
MESCETTLHEIIAFRKFHQWKWSHAEVTAILIDLANALGYLESQGIVHRDIRPHNIWYCSESHQYKIGGF